MRPGASPSPPAAPPVPPLPASRGLRLPTGLRGLLLALLVAGPLVPPSAARAQPTPADSAGILLRVARELEAGGRRELSRALLELVRERWPGTPAALEAARLLDELRGRGRPGRGRTELVVWGTTYGLWLGVAVPVALGAEREEWFGLGLLLGGPGGFFASRAYADRHRPTEGEARTFTFAGMWGTWQGLGWRDVLDWGDRRVEYECPVDGPWCVPSESEETPSEVVFRAMVVGGLAGLLAGRAVVGARAPSPGTATAASLGALWGSWYGFAGAGVVGVDGGDAVLAWTLLGGDAGLVAGALLGARGGLSRSQARLASIAGVAGLVAGFGLDLLLGVDDRSMALGIPAATSAVGLYLGAVWARGRGGGSAAAAGDGWPVLGLTLLPVEGPRGPVLRPGVRAALPCCGSGPG